MSLSSPFARLATVFGPMRARAPLPTFERRAQGIVDKSDPLKRRMVVTVDADTFERVSAAAAASGVSTTEALRQLIRRGLDASPSA
jgi:hypothetical protein